MGQTICLDLRENEDAIDIRVLPLEICTRILEYLKPHELCTISLVNSQWNSLANHDLLWKKQCIRRVREINQNAASQLQMKWKQVFHMVQSMIFYFNINGNKGLSMFFELSLMDNSPQSIALFLDTTRNLNKFQIGQILSDPSREQVIRCFVGLQKVQGVFLAEALKAFLSKFQLSKAIPIARHSILDIFAEHYWYSNQSRLSHSTETTVLLVFSLVLLSIDLSSPHIKNKMTKREFIRNLRMGLNSEARLSTDYLGQLYDFVFIQGLIEPNESTMNSRAPRVCHTIVNQLSQDRFHSYNFSAIPRVLMLR